MWNEGTALLLGLLLGGALSPMVVGLVRWWRRRQSTRKPQLHALVISSAQIESVDRGLDGQLYVTFSGLTADGEKVVLEREALGV